MTLPNLDSMTSSPRMMLAVGGGVVGGLVLGALAAQHLFVEGLSDEEKNGMLKVAAVGLFAWGVTQLVGQEQAWWLDLDSISKHFEGG